MLLGYAIESITGTSFADFVHSEFAVPPGLIDTGMCGTSNLPLSDGYGLFTTSQGPLWARLCSGLSYGPAIAVGGLWVAASQALS